MEVRQTERQLRNWRVYFAAILPHFLPFVVWGIFSSFSLTTRTECAKEAGEIRRERNVEGKEKAPLAI